VSEDVERQGYVLVVGPGDADRASAEATLLEGGLVVATATPGETLAIPDLTPPRLVVLDDSTTHEERMKALKLLRRHPPLTGVPVLVLAYDTGVDSYTAAITKGAAAYLLKPTNAEELQAVARRLSGWVGHGDQTERRRRVRRPLLIKLELVNRATKVTLSGTMLDASGGGCRIELGQEVAKGELVRVILHAQETSTHLALGGEVRWHAQAKDGSHQIGMKFTGTTAMLAGKLLGFASTGTT
jgi:CheY-like chemotaxis protein